MLALEDIEFIGASSIKSVSALFHEKIVLGLHVILNQFYNLFIYLRISKNDTMKFKTQFDFILRMSYCKYLNQNTTPTNPLLIKHTIYKISQFALYK